MINNNISVIILAGGFGTSLQTYYSNIPKALIPIGHNPCICILLETLIEFDDIISDIHIVIFERYYDLFCKEISRWFYNNKKIKIISINDTQGTAKSIEYIMDNKFDNMNNDILILHSNMPLISKITLKDFIYNYKNKNFKFLSLVSKLTNKNEYDKALIIDNDNIKEIVYFKEIVDHSQFEYSFLNTILIKKTLLQALIKTITINTLSEEFHIIDIFKNSEIKSKAYVLNPYIANKECVIIKKNEDKNFAEENYLERRNIMFINQCYSLWKKCEIFENRISFLEKKINELTKIN
jgi:bifunctional N-acetylglucosamine-1-phosphate-uridyltransferase/glucosamine-1-phosphate-acetyltransferase GlmU-like protein